MSQDTASQKPAGLAHHASKLAMAACSATFIYLAYGLLKGTWRSWTYLAELSTAQFSSAEGIVHAFGSVALLAGALAAYLHLARRHAPYRPVSFLLAVGAVWLIVAWLLVANVQPRWVSDYLRYWQHGVALAGGDSFAIKDWYDQRSLLFVYPIARMFGPDAVVELKLLNCMLLLAIWLMIYDITRLTRSQQAAQATSVLVLLAPIPWLSALIPSHDFWGTFLMAAAVWCFVRAIHTDSQAPRSAATKLAMYSIACGFFTYLFEYQRTVGTVLAIAFVAGALATLSIIQPSSDTGRRFRIGHRALFAALLCVLLQPGLSRIGSQLDIYPGKDIVQSSTHGMKLAAHAGAMGTATSDWYARFSDRFRAKQQQSADATRSFALSIAGSTWVLTPEAKLLHLAEHMPRLFDLGYPQNWDILLRGAFPDHPQLRSSGIWSITLFGSLAGTVAALVLLALAARPQQAGTSIVVCSMFVAALSALLLILFENKPPNISPVWLLAALLSGRVADWIAPSTGTGNMDLKRGLLALAMGGASIVVCAFIVWAGARAFFTVERGLIISDWKREAVQSQPIPEDWELALDGTPPRSFDPPYYRYEQRPFVLKGARNDGPRLLEFSRAIYATLEFPAPLTSGDQAALTSQVCARGEAHDLEMFMFSPVTRSDVSDVFTVEIFVAGMSRVRMGVPFEGGSMALIDIPDAIPQSTGCVDVRIELRSNLTTSSPSWRRASRIEIWAPRLTMSESTRHHVAPLPGRSRTDEEQRQ